MDCTKKPEARLRKEQLPNLTFWFENVKDRQEFLTSILGGGDRVSGAEPVPLQRSLYRRVACWGIGEGSR